MCILTSYSPEQRKEEFGTACKMVNRSETLLRLELYTLVFLLEEQIQSDLLRPVNVILSLTEHDGVDDESHDVLHDEEGDGGRTLLRYHPPSEADGHLNLDGEQEGRRERPGERKSFCLKAVSVSFCFRANAEILADLMGKAALNVSDV